MAGVFLSPVPHQPLQILSSHSQLKATTMPHQSINNNSKRMIVPSLAAKVNECFFKYISDKEKTEQLNELFNFIRVNNRQPKPAEFQMFSKSISNRKQQQQTLTQQQTPPVLIDNDILLKQSNNGQQQQQNRQLTNTTSGLSIAASSSSVVFNHMRSKSPPSLHSPPMSPISRMPNSPKSPRQRLSLSNNNNNNNNNNSNTTSTNLNSQKQLSFNNINNNGSGGQKESSPRLALDDKSNAKTNALKQHQQNNEKEIQIQRVTSASEQQLQQQKKVASDVRNQMELGKASPVNYIDLKVMNNGVPVLTKPGADATSKQQQQQQQHHHPANKYTGGIQKQKLQQIHVPQFYFPSGKPDEKQFKQLDDAESVRLLNAEFKLQKEGKVYKESFAPIVKILGLPHYWKILLFRACSLGNKFNYVTYSNLEQVWSKLTSTCHDRPTLFVKLMSNNGNTISYDDWEPLMQDIVDTHPGLKFLHDHKEFHTRYIKTVIARIYYTCNRSWSGRITLTELRRSNFLSVLESLEHEDDINLIKDYFSYEHFYVIYCKFWELDKDHDLFISKEDLYRHNNYAISPRVIDRIFSGTVLRGKDWRDGLMSYYDFVWFLISEEDKRNATSVEYWFRVLDLDGDGVLSMYELEYFYNEQIEQMRERQIEFMPFTDLLCQILDLVKPSENGKIHLKDLKQCKMTNVFFDTFINLEKYLEYEQRDPFSNMRDLDGPEQSDWEKYAADEYENLVSEDVNADNQDLYNNYEDDFDDENFYNSSSLNSPNSNNGLNGNGNSSNANGIGQNWSGSNGNSSNSNGLAGDLALNNRNRIGSVGNGNSNGNSPSSPTNTSSFITNRSSFDER